MQQRSVKRGEIMQPSYSSIGQLFSAQTRYVVPLFQRPYVWSEDDQWRPLWDDVEALASRVLDPPAHKPVAGHFLGTVVLEQLQTAAIAMPQRQVIDGQQRLTTLQILLRAAEHALVIAGERADEVSSGAFQLAAGQVSQLSRNQFAASAEESYKVWPTNDDRDAFKSVMDCAAKEGVGQQASRMADAYRFFKRAALEWLGGDRAPQRALSFASALKDHLRLVVLDLDENDEPQAIFETLNAHGTPLLPADLMKNWLLWKAGEQGLVPEELYSSYWSEFDRDHEYWRKNVGTGHAARPRVDTFLQNWLTTTTLEAISPKHLYDRFLAFANKPENADIAALMGDICQNATLYRKIDAPDVTSEIGKVFHRLNRMDFVVFRPVLMAILSRPASDEADELQCAAAIESFLVRRMVCDLQTRGYGTLALELVRVIQQAPGDSLAIDYLVSALENASAGGWPDDAAFMHSWTTKKFYGWFRRDRVAMLLQAMEEHFQSEASKSEPVLKFDYSKLTIEHVMPQAWHTHWPITPGIEPPERDRWVQNIGNLTLVSGKLNPSLSNSAWQVDGSAQGKRIGLSAHSDLKLNKILLSEAAEIWDEAAIAERAKRLFQAASVIWPICSKDLEQ
ncbi:MAG: DUF262 domain-containing protein [Alphaproteobacteria bacterium]|nr:MAG: DUF262 domain-containing protein [Alphaproteobacteria bacterium]